MYINNTIKNIHIMLQRPQKMLQLQNMLPNTAKSIKWQHFTKTGLLAQCLANCPLIFEVVAHCFSVILSERKIIHLRYTVFLTLKLVSTSRQD